MNRQKWIFAGKSLAVLSVIPALVYAISTGPEPARSGAPGESTCNDAACHAGTTLNGGGGSIQITAEGGANYTPGVTQKISVKVSDPLQKRWGFQLTARLASESKTRAGILKATDNTVPSTGAAFFYLVRAGNPCGKGTLGFGFSGGSSAERTTDLSCP